MSIVVEIFIGIIGSYVVYRQESIESRLTKLEMRISNLIKLIPTRCADKPLDKGE